jgi:hypothetical protein
MQKFGITILFLVLAIAAALALVNHHSLRTSPAGKRVYGYHEDTGNGTNAPEIFFEIGEFQSGLHMGPCGFGNAVNWSYHVVLSGASNRFPSETIEVQPSSLDGPVHLARGNVLINRVTNEITIALKVQRGTNIEDFVGNGTFKIDKNP